MNSHDGDLTNESLLIAPLSNKGLCITWKQIVKEMLNDKVLSRVFRCIEEGWSLKHVECLSVLCIYDCALYVSNGVILYTDRIVMPLSLSPHVLI